MRLKKLRRINQICKLGIGGGALTPVLLPEIRKIIPSYSATVLWVDDNYKFTNIFDEVADDLSIIQSYLDEYLDHRDREARFSLSEWLKSGGDMTSTEELANKRNLVIISIKLLTGLISQEDICFEGAHRAFCPNDN